MPTVRNWWGEISYATEDIITFPRGIIGFEGVKQYILIPLGETPFRILQAVDGSGLAFVVVDPNSFVEGYELALANDEEGAAIYCIVTVPNDPAQMTANLRAPLVIDLVRRQGRQEILEEAYPLRFPLRKPVTSPVEVAAGDGRDPEDKEVGASA